MSRQLPRSSAIQAGLAALIVIGLLLLLVVAGHNNEEAAGEAETSGVVPARDLEGGMRSIASDKLFETVTAAQREAGTWYVISASEQEGQELAPSVQEVSLEGDGPAIRTTFDSGMGTIEALYIGDQFYIKGFTGTAKPWWKVSTDDTASRLITSLTPYADPTEFLASMTSPKKFEVLGVEEIEALTGESDQGSGQGATVSAVHYRMQIEALGEQAPGTAPDQDAPDQDAPAGTPMQMDMWVDRDNRPVRVETVVNQAGQRFTTRLYYGLYGEDVTIEAPSRDQVTTRPPAELRDALAGAEDGS